MPSQAVRRISLRWLPDPAFEDTDTVALNVGGYFVDLRVTKDTGAIQWSRAGERIVLKEVPRKFGFQRPCRDSRLPINQAGLVATFRWTHIIDSLDLTVPDDAHFVKLPNGDDLEVGTTPAPHLNNVPTDYEEVWRDITDKSPEELSWILESSDRTTFIGKVGCIFLAIQKTTEAFSARREDRQAGVWKITFNSGITGLPSAYQAIEAIESKNNSWAVGQSVTIGGVEFIFRAVSKE